MKKFNLLLMAIFFLPCVSIAIENNEVKAFLKSVFTDNAKHVQEIEREDFKIFADHQSPRATIVSCSDSRVQTKAFHRSPINDLFYIRNIGNQIKTAEGSVEYGIDHLHTPLLLIIGHSNCGAIAAALGNYSAKTKAIRTELDHLHLSPKIETNQGVIENVNNQVAYALEKFKDKIAKGELVVVGAVYDFRDDFDHDHGRLILINLNGEKDPNKIKQNEYVKGIKDIVIGIK